MKPNHQGGAWRRIGFQRLWGANTVWSLGVEVTELALPTLAILGFEASPAQAGLLIAAPWITFLVVGLPVGALVDRLPRRRVMVFADLSGLPKIVGQADGRAIDSMEARRGLLEEGSGESA